MRSIDQLVDTLLQEMKIAAEPPARLERNRWSEVVRSVVLKRPELSRLGSDGVPSAESHHEVRPWAGSDRSPS